jgi:anti-sigma-K factor RskA
MIPDDCGQTELAAAWVLGALPPWEGDRFARHLEQCPVCRAEVARLQPAADAMAEAVAPETPPPALQERLTAAVDVEAQLFRAAGSAEAVPPAVGRSSGRSPRRGLLVTAALALATVGAAVGYVLGQQDGEDAADRVAVARTIAGAVAEANAGSNARAAVVVDADGARLVLSGLEPPPDGRLYQAWILRAPSVPRPTGALFSVRRTGQTTVEMPALREVDLIIVTDEPAAGSRSPTLPPVVIVRLH